MGGTWRAALALAATVLASPAASQDATLTARDGGLSLSGELIAFDGEVYRIATAYGPLTVNAEGVICTGPACPALTFPRARIAVTGASDPGLRLMPPLWAAFARARGLRLDPSAGPGWQATLSDPATGEALADLAFAPAPAGAATAALRDGRATLAVLAEAPEGLNSRALGAEALVPVASRDNRLPRLATADLARMLSGQAATWAAAGGPDMPVVVHALDPGDALGAAAAARLGPGGLAPAVLHPDAGALDAAVARDPWAVALTAAGRVSAARILPLTDSCGFALPATEVEVRAGDYPLTVTWHLVAPRRRLPLILREFLEFTATDAAQAAVAAAGLTDRRALRAPLAADGRRILGAVRAGGAEVPLAELQRLAAAMEGGERLSVTFRFEDGSSRLDAASETALADLAAAIAARAFDGWRLTLAGFSDGSGAAATNLALSRSRAEAVRATLARIAPDLSPDDLPAGEAWGEAPPRARDTTEAGGRINRRVEVWLHPIPEWDGPPAAE
ncbi:MAG TPA: OmpA family protein [Paracoccaceae bacterium]|nr:OmpA family protein [Paracoccaceae bacterium]